jgi:hypothetical protein
MMAMPQGNGQPIVGGSVSAVSGTSLTVTNSSNVTYAIDASSATVFKKGATSTVADIAVGDEVIVQGAVSGQSVTANSVIDHGTKLAPSAAATNADRTSPASSRGKMGGFFGGIGNLFHRMFGFF